MWSLSGGGPEARNRRLKKKEARRIRRGVTRGYCVGQHDYRPVFFLQETNLPNRYKNNRHSCRPSRRSGQKDNTYFTGFIPWRLAEQEGKKKQQSGNAESVTERGCAWSISWDGECVCVCQGHTMESRNIQTYTITLRHVTHFATQTQHTNPNLPTSAVFLDDA